MSLTPDPGAGNSGKPSRPANSSDFLKMSTVAYTVMGAVGFEICWWWHQNIGALLGPVRYSIRDSLVMVVAGILFLLMLQRVLEDFFPSYKKFKSTLASHIGQFGWFGSLWLALISAAGEELLFRGALQPFLGVWLTSILFGLLHLDPDEGLTAWTAWALIAGLILGASCNVTGSLWPALIIHFTINFWGLRSLAKINVQSTKQKPSGIA